MGARGRKSDRTGLLIRTKSGEIYMKAFFLSLIFFILIFSGFYAPRLCAQETETEEVPFVSVTVSPDILTPNTLFNLTFIIDYPDPNEVTVTAPAFPASLTLNQIVRYPVMTESRMRTVVEYRLTANRGGIITLDSFSINMPQASIQTGSFAIRIQNPAIEQRFITPRLYWEGAQTGGARKAGDRITLILRAQNWTSRQPPSSFFMPEVPRGVILSSQNISAAERESGILLKMTLIPLSAGDFNLSARVLEYENIRFEIPALNISVNNR